MSAEQITNIITDATKHEIEPPRPLRRPLRPANPYPVQMLGDLLNAAAVGIQSKTLAPIEICAQSVLAAATLAVQGHADVELPFGQTRPLSCFFITIADSGERKSSCDQEALRPFEQKEERGLSEHKSEMSSWQNKMTAWEKARTVTLHKSKSESPEAIAAKLDALGDAPPPPINPLLTCPEPTYEGICRHLKYGEPSVGVFADEGGQFASGHGMQEDNRTKTAAAFCSLWDGKPIKRVRAGDGTTVLLGRRISVHLMMQHSVANTLLSDSGLLDQGLLSRFLLCAPESTIGTRFSTNVNSSSIEALDEYNAEISRILDLLLPLKEGTQNELNPRTLKLNGEASCRWIGFSDEVEKKMAKGNEWKQIRGFANKIPEQAARIAGVLALIDNINAGVIEGHHMHSGILLSAYYAGEALRLQEHGYADPDLILAEKLLEWLHESWSLNKISLPDIYQRSLNAISDKKTAKRIVSVLEDHGWLSKLENGASIKGCKRREAWSIVGKH